ncbi:MAG: hypothetical protein ACYTBJ_05330 [Planctomycetota bacterium]|jgi:hypothetical protein
MSLADLYEKIATVDVEAEQERTELEKLAAEEDAAGRITARGFMDELNKLAAAMGPLPGMKAMAPQAAKAGAAYAKQQASAMKPPKPATTPPAK